jgi:F-type H+-transporting ATPase subunit gamma
MKMVAAAKLRRAQEAVVQSRAYAEKLGEVVAGLAPRARCASTAGRERIPQGASC